MLLTKDQILNANDAVYEIVEVPEWGGTVKVRGLTASQRDYFESRYMVETKGDTIPNEFRAPFVALVLVGEDGKPLFTLADVKKLGEKNGEVISRIFAVGAKLSGMQKGAIEAAKND